MQIFVYKSNQQYGPYSLSQIRKFVSEDRFSLNDNACYDGQNWVLIRNIPRFSQTAPPPPKSLKSKVSGEKKGWSGKAILSFVMVFFTVLAPIAVFLAHFARRDIVKNNLKGGWLTIVTLILGYIFSIGMLVGIAWVGFYDITHSDEEEYADFWINTTGEAYITSYLALVGKYPTSFDDLRTPPNGIDPFILNDTDLEDPWGNEYRYQYPGKFNLGGFDIWTISPSGMIIGNWENTSKANELYSGSYNYDGDPNGKEGIYVLNPGGHCSLIGDFGTNKEMEIVCTNPMNSWKLDSDGNAVLSFFNSDLNCVLKTWITISKENYYLLDIRSFPFNEEDSEFKQSLNDRERPRLIRSLLN
jgi:hypothetical protein